MTERSTDLQAVKDISRLQRQVTVEQAQATLQLASMTSGRCLRKRRGPTLQQHKCLRPVFSGHISVLLQKSSPSCTSLMADIHPAELTVHPL